MITYNKPNANEPKLNFMIGGSMCPIFNDGDLITCVGLCWEYANTQGHEYEIIDVRYGSIDGVLMPEICDIKQTIQEEMGLQCVLSFPDTFTHDPKL